MKSRTVELNTTFYDGVLQNLSVDRLSVKTRNWLSVLRCVTLSNVRSDWPCNYWLINGTVKSDFS